ncbi:30S ribosomal protein S11 [Candidatus Dojkabacteria bacterium]|nr:30S ribosomal protein S11 [Candidatus Dojkabacteria bacterium]
MGKKKVLDKSEQPESVSKETSKDKKATTKASKSKKRKDIPKARVYVNCSYNSTVITFTDYSGNVFAWSSSGCSGFRGSKKGTAFAATKAAYDAYDKASKYGVKEASVIVKGVGMGRRAAVKGLRTAGLIITSLSDRTPIPHNGCRPRKKPRGS